MSPPNDAARPPEGTGQVAAAGPGDTAHEDTADDRPADEPIPHHLWAETIVLGAAMWSPDAARALVTDLDRDDLDRYAHQLVFEAIQSLVADDTPVDVLTVTDRLILTRKLDAVGGPLALHDLLDVVPTVAAWPTYLLIVKREADRRRTLVRLRQAIRRLEAGEDPAVVCSEMVVAA